MQVVPGEVTGTAPNASAIPYSLRVAVLPGEGTGTCPLMAIWQVTIVLTWLRRLLWEREMSRWWRRNGMLLAHLRSVNVEAYQRLLSSRPH